MLGYNYYSTARYESCNIQSNIATWGHEGIGVFIKKSIGIWVSHLLSIHMDMHM